MKTHTVTYIFTSLLVFVLSVFCVVGCDTSHRLQSQQADQAQDEKRESSEVTLEEIKADLNVMADTDALSAEELLARGKQYENGEGVPVWYSMAQLYYEAAQGAGSPDAQTALDNLSRLRESVLAQSENAQGELFARYRAGVTAGQNGDYAAAYASAYDNVFFFNDPEKRGLGSIAELLRDGRGIEQDVDEAVKIFTFMAVELGKGNGYTELGHMYGAPDGTYPGIKHSNDKALENYLKSYEADTLKEADFKGPRYAGDLYDVGYTHDDGSIAAPDYVKAEQCYLRASEGNGRTFDGTSCYKLGTYYEEGREDIEQDYAKAAQYYEKAVSDKNVHATMLGIPQTYLSLGRFYEYGQGVEKNVEKAISYYHKALEAADENLVLKEAAGNKDMQRVHDEAAEALDRLH